MALITLFRTDDGVERLMAQPAEVRPAAATDRETALAESNPRHTRLFEAYRSDLRTAYGIASLWWEDTVAAQEKLGKSREDAIEEAFDRRLAGAASHPKVVWIVRSYWLACEEINAELPAGERVRPEVFCLKWLVDIGESELVRLLACMPYWPIGLDENGNWC
jgi:hypothetical protein